MTSDITVSAQGLEKRYGDLVAVDGVSFETLAGECFGFLGPNGAGKTSTMRMIGGVSPVGRGRLTVLGLSVAEHPREVKARLGVVPQEENLELDLTVRENLTVYGRYFHLPAPLLRERTEALLELVQLRDKADSLVRVLSGGMKRRLLVARAFINEPHLVILDEPTTGLDPQARHLVWEKLRRLKGQNRTLLLTTHYMDEAEQLCDRLVVMEKGKILAHGRPRDLIREHVSRDVVELSGDRELRARLLSRFRDRVTAFEMLEERLLFFTGDGEGIVHALTEEHLDGVELSSRRATLEDVFLKLTGRSLSE